MINTYLANYSWKPGDPISSDVSVMEITEQSYRESLARLEASKAYWDQYAVGNCLDSTKYPDDPATNDDRTIVEVYSFQYLDAGKKNGYFAYWQGGAITTWTGVKLGTVLSTGREYRVPTRGVLPSVRVPFRARGIDDQLYSGTFYKSSGDYVRMRRIKGK
jgi:hypothetical protein